MIQYCSISLHYTLNTLTDNSRCKASLTIIDFPYSCKHSPSDTTMTPLLTKNMCYIYTLHRYINIAMTLIYIYIRVIAKFIKNCIPPILSY